jgi:hypothetical protein
MTDELALPAANIPDVDGAVKSMRLFQELKEKLLTENDVVKISGKSYIKRSGWRRVALAFNVSTSVLEVQRERVGEDQIVVRARVRATAPNGRFSEDVGVCDSSEFKTGRIEVSLHNIETKAVTRALNRAISDLCGGGEVSAEELPDPEAGRSAGEVRQQVDRAGTPTPAVGVHVGASPQSPQPPSDSLIWKRITWKVGGQEFPVDPAQPPYASLVKAKTMEALKTKLKAEFLEDVVGGYIVSLDVGTSSLELQEKVFKDIQGPLEWAIRTIAKCASENVKLSFELREAPTQ